MSKYQSLLVGGLLCASLASAHEPTPYETHTAVELAKGECSDPKMTDEERAERIARSQEEAVKCMGEEWANGGRNLVRKVDLGGVNFDIDITHDRLVFTDLNGQDHTYLISPGVPDEVSGDDTETLTGDFSGPFRLEGPDYVVQNKDKDYVGAPMPWAIFWQGGYAVHGVGPSEIGQLGQPASHGCVRTRTENAAFMNSQVAQANDRSANMHIYGTAVYHKKKPRAKPVAKRRAPVDQVDPIEDNPQYDSSY